MAVTNVMITIPSIVILILLSIATGSHSIVAMGIIIGITSWPWTARAVRAQSSSIRSREHVEIARLSGAGHHVAYRMGSNPLHALIYRHGLRAAAQHRQC